MKFIFDQLQDVELYLNRNNASEERWQAFNFVKDFVESGSYSAYRRFNELFEVRFETIERQRKILGIASENLRKVRSELTRDALGVIGNDTLNTIMYGSDKDVKKLLRDLPLVLEKPVVKMMFPLSLFDLLDKTEPNLKASFPISDCKPELALLYWLSADRLPELISNVDVDRLAYLIRCLEKIVGTRDDRLEIMRVLKSDDLFSHLRAEDKKTFSFPPVRDEEVV